MFRKSQKISTASDQYFLSYVNKTTGGGVKLTPPPPPGIGLNPKVLFSKNGKGKKGGGGNIFKNLYQVTEIPVFILILLA